ncbi:SLC13 family permease [Caballeronia sp. LP003]|uniref:SLC13 family permease n=1 Tax=Caballeronia sp. LP003 TaxID=3038551 RepID=UPI00285E1310|nr:SLC13 family permease [Caballeronia sp. LP003]MDR5785452.1 SLC13 family permease [Caballeronia sp. LP003]
MNSYQTLSLLGLGVIVVLSVWRSLNLGLIAFACVFLVASLMGMSPKAYLAKFPVDLCLLIIGVSLLFEHCARSGGIDWLLTCILKFLGPSSPLLTWIPFCFGLLLGTVGGFPGAVVAIVAPIAATISCANNRDYLTVATLAVWGATAGAFSPIGSYGAAIRVAAENAGLAYSPWSVYMSILVSQTLLAGVASLVLPKTAQRSANNGLTRSLRPKNTKIESSVANTWYRRSSIGALAVFIGAVASFKIDIGLLAILLSLILQLVFRPSEKEILKAVPWSVVLLLGGLLTYIGLLDRIGNIDALEATINGIGSPTIAVFVILYLVALLGNIDSSSLGVLSITAPLALTVTANSSEASIGILAAVGLLCSITTISPVHVGGGMILGNSTEGDDKNLLRRLLSTVATLSCIVPCLMAAFLLVLL